MDTCTGLGFDVHSFEPGDHVMLCGVKIPFNKGLKGHSDADVGLHAITDAIFGAIGAEDIGHHFPPSDPKWKDAASHQFLSYAVQKVKEMDGRIVNLDIILICEAPKISSYREAMRINIASLTSLPRQRVNVKGTTTERLGFTGRNEGIAAQAIATVSLPSLEGETEIS